MTPINGLWKSGSKKKRRAQQFALLMAQTEITYCKRTALTQLVQQATAQKTRYTRARDMDSSVTFVETRLFRCNFIFTCSSLGPILLL